MNPIYLNTRFKRDGENDPTFNELESLRRETAYLWLMSIYIRVFAI